MATAPHATVPIRPDMSAMIEFARIMAEHFAALADDLEQATRNTQALREVAADHAEWFCHACGEVCPYQPGDRFTRPCPACRVPMVPSSPNRREIQRLRAELADTTGRRP